MSDNLPNYLNIDLKTARTFKLNIYETIVLSFLNYKLNIKDILTIDNDGIVLELSKAGIDISLSTLKRALNTLKKHNLIKVRTTYNPETNRNKRQIAKGQIEHLVKSKNTSPDVKKCYKYNKKSDNRAKVLKEPTINNNINNIKTIKNNDKTADKTYYIILNNQAVPVSLETYNNTSPELRFN